MGREKLFMLYLQEKENLKHQQKKRIEKERAGYLAQLQAKKDHFATIAKEIRDDVLLTKYQKAKLYRQLATLRREQIGKVKETFGKQKGTIWEEGTISWDGFLEKESKTNEKARELFQKKKDKSIQKTRTTPEIER